MLSRIKDQEKNIFNLFAIAGVIALWYMFNENFQVGAGYTILLMFSAVVILLGRKYYG